MINQVSFDNFLENISRDFHPLVPFDKVKDKIALLDLAKTNSAFNESIYTDMDVFENYIAGKRESSGARYLLGGYKEEREMYRRSGLFDKNIEESKAIVDEPRSIHLGVDIWGPAGTPVFAPIGGVVYGFAFNDKFGDYGATIILQHQVDATTFYTLYGHLSLRDLGPLREGLFINRGQNFAHFGAREENGHWPPHLHFQVIYDIGINLNDYPGVCKPSESVYFLSNSPNPHPFIHYLFN
jgi:murein DD-endopeptidase MepM/ murein hydrolase activator NlpD